MKVSLVMGVYNGERFLSETLDSILAQTYSDLEIIIVDDGSTDSTAEILNSIKDERLRIIHLDTNKGVANALNVAISQAKGDWIAVHDADDISLPEKIKEQAAYLKENPKLIAVGSFIECIGVDDSTEHDIAKMKNLERYKNSIKTWRQIRGELFKGCPLTHGSLIYSKNSFIKAGRYDPRYKIASDYDFFMRLAPLGPIENIPKVLYKYRVSPNSLSNTNVYETSDEFLLCATKYIRSYCFNNKGDIPKVMVIGKDYGCQRFRELMLEEENLSVQGMITHYDKDEIYNAFKYYKLGRINAFVILSGVAEQNEIVSMLIRKGLRLNKDIFTLWSAV